MVFYGQGMLGIRFIMIHHHDPFGFIMSVIFLINLILHKSGTPERGARGVDRPCCLLMGRGNILGLVVLITLSSL